MNDELTPAEMAEACEVTIDTLRYYEREGLLDQILRTDGGQRRFSLDDVAWVRVLRCLRTTAMPIREMRRFADLVRVGDSAILERVELLAAHRVVVLDQMEELHRALEMIDHKLAAYSTTTAADGTPPVSDEALPNYRPQEA
jgi:DNA-binding transcriptional MerR regulator